MFFRTIYFWLCWVFVAAHGLSLLVGSGSYFLLRCTSFSLQWLLLMQSIGFGACGLQQLWTLEPGSIVVVHGLSCPLACGIFPDQGSNPCVLHWQANYLLLTYKGSHVEVLTTVSVGNPLASSRSLSGSPVLFGLAPSKIV